MLEKHYSAIALEDNRYFEYRKKTNEIPFGIHLDYLFCVQKGNVNRNETKIASSSLETRNFAVYRIFRATFD